MIIPVLSKQPLDVHFEVAVRKLANGIYHPTVAIVTPSKDNKPHSYIYSSIYDLTDQDSTNEVFDQDTEVYKNANAMFDADGFNDPLEVVEYPTGGGSSVASVKGGQISETSDSPIADTILDGLDSSVLYVIPTSDVKESDAETIAKALYDTQSSAFMIQFSKTDDAKKFAQNISSYEADGGKNFCNAKAFVVTDGKYPVAQGAAYAASHAPIDIMHVGNGDQFEPTDLSASTVTDLRKNHITVIENKADDYMFSDGDALGNGYLDQFVNSKIFIDDMTYSVQKFLNHNKDTYNDTTIHLLKDQVKSEAGSLAGRGFLIGRPKVTALSRSQSNPNDIEKRVYRGLTIDAELFGDIQNIDGKIDLTI